MNDYFRAAGVVNRRKIRVEDFKGFRVPLLDDLGAEWAVNWLISREIESWYLDPWRVVCSSSGVNEYLDPEVGPLVERIDAIKREARVAHVHVNHHCGARDVARPRGATTLADWADAIWLYAREQDARYLSATGRGVELEEGAVTLEDGRLSFQESSRKDRELARAREQLVAYVEAHPGCKTTDATYAVDGGNTLRSKAVSSAKDRGLIEVPKGSAKLLYPAGSEPQEQFDV
jgi:hypothetical protein